MNVPAGWTNPITAGVGQVQRGVDPNRLLPFRIDLIGWRLDLQRQYLATKSPRTTLIRVTRDGVISDGHHGARAAAEAGILVDVKIVEDFEEPCGLTIMQLPVR